MKVTIEILDKRKKLNELPNFRLKTILVIRTYPKLNVRISNGYYFLIKDIIFGFINTQMIKKGGVIEVQNKNIKLHQLLKTNKKKRN